MTSSPIWDIRKVYWYTAATNYHYNIVIGHLNSIVGFRVNKYVIPANNWIPKITAVYTMTSQFIAKVSNPSNTLYPHQSKEVALARASSPPSAIYKLTLSSTLQHYWHPWPINFTWTIIPTLSSKIPKSSGDLSHFRINRLQRWPLKMLPYTGIDTSFKRMNVLFNSNDNSVPNVAWQNIHWLVKYL